MVWWWKGSTSSSSAGIPVAEARQAPVSSPNRIAGFGGNGRRDGRPPFCPRSTRVVVPWTPCLDALRGRDDPLCSE